MRIRLISAAIAVALASPAAAQLPALQDRPLSAAERTRMTLLEAQFSRISTQRNTSFAALRTIARALGSKLTALAPDEVLKSIDDRAQELVKARGRIQEMEGQLDQLDSMRLAKAVSPLLAAAKVAIDEGRLDDADAQLADAAARFGAARTNLQGQVDAIGASEADVLAQQAGVRSSLSDFVGAATLYAKAAELSEVKRPQTAWDFRMQQVGALEKRETAAGRSDALAEALVVLNTKALPLAPRAERPEDWAATQFKIGAITLLVAVYAQDGVGYERALAAFRLAADGTTPATPPDTRTSRKARVAEALSLVGLRHESQAEVDEAMKIIASIPADEPGRDWYFYHVVGQVYDNAAALRQKQGRKAEATAAMISAIEAQLKAGELIDRTTELRAYVRLQSNIANQYVSLAEYKKDPEDARRAAVVTTAALALVKKDEMALAWAHLKATYGAAIVRILEMKRDETGAALADALSALDAAATVLTRTAYPAFFAEIQFDKGRAYAASIRDRYSPEQATAAISALNTAIAFFNRKDRPTVWAEGEIRIGGVIVMQARTASGSEKGPLVKQAGEIFAEVRPIVEKSDDGDLKAALDAGLTELRALD